MSNDERAQFKAALSQSLSPDGLTISELNAAWWAWQARAAIAQPAQQATKAERVRALVNAGPCAGMSEAFDRHMGADVWTDPAYSPDASTWAAAWKAALAHVAEQADAQPVAWHNPRADALRAALREIADTKNLTATPTQFARWLQRTAEAALTADAMGEPAAAHTQRQPLTDENDPVVGHKTFRDGPIGFRHEPLRSSEATALMAAVEAANKRRAELMPDENSAIRMMFEARQRLIELGWNDAIYCPKDGSEFDAIEAGSTGIHRCHYSGEWPTGSWWIAGDGDLYPSRPVLYRKPPPDGIGEGEKP